MTEREKLIELMSYTPCRNEICNFCEHYKKMYACQRHRTGAVADYLLANGVTFVSDTNVGKWIPVTERMPERNIGVLVYAPRLKNIFETFYNKNGEWEIVSYHREILNDEITHWMPLPEPPERMEK